MNFTIPKIDCEILSMEVSSGWGTPFSLCEHPLMFCLATTATDEGRNGIYKSHFGHTYTYRQNIAEAKRTDVPVRHFPPHLGWIP